MTAVAEIKKPRRRNGEKDRVARKQPAALARAEQSTAVSTEVREPEPANMLELIARASRDPAVNVDTMERLMAMAERQGDRNAKVAYIRAFSDMQPKLPVIPAKGRIVIPPKDGKAGQETAYAKWEDISAIITPILLDHGFNLSFRSGATAEGRVKVVAVLSHIQGHAEETELVLPIENSGSKNNVQGIGSSLSYGKRYTATFLLNIITGGEDDDGLLAGKAGKVEREDPYNEVKPKLRPAVQKWMGEQLDIALELRDVGVLEGGLADMQRNSLWKEAAAKDPEGTALIKRKIEDHITVLKEG